MNNKLASKLYTREFLLAMAAYVIVLVISVTLINISSASAWWRIPLALAPVVPIIFAIGAAFTLLTALLMPQTSKVSGVSVADIVNAPWWTFILLGFSRVLAITTHLGLVSLTVLAYRRSWLFYPLAVFAHFVLDFTTFGVQSLTSSSLWTLLVFALWAIAALFLILRIRHMDPAVPEQRSQHLENSPTTITG